MPTSSPGPPSFVVSPSLPADASDVLTDPLSTESEGEESSLQPAMVSANTKPQNILDSPMDMAPSSVISSGSNLILRLIHECKHGRKYRRCVDEF